MTEERKRKRLILLAFAVAIVLIAGIGIGAYGFSVADNAGQPDAPAEQPGKSAGETKPVTPPAAKSRVMGAPEKNQDGGSGGEVAEEASSSNTMNSPGTTNIPNATNTPDTTNSESTGNTGNTGSGEPSTGSGSDSGGDAKAPDPNAGKTWHEAWSEWIVDVPGHYEQQLVSAAWDEETGHWGDRCNVCGAETTGFADQHMRDTGHAGYTSPVWFAGSTIHHNAVYQDVWIAEQGHSVWHEGYWE